ncbi:MAG: TonB-dependent receptor, partial [Gammaproteobacteria bacterium]|nr:TonB-dependent receptor [Gammaproteobacteria bacterium]
ALFTRYDRPVNWGSFGTGSWYVGADYTYQGSRYASEHNLIETGDNELVGARLGATLGNWDFSVWAKNLFDDDTAVDIQRYIDRRASEGGALPTCASYGAGLPPGTICAGSSTSARGFGVALQRGRQIGATLNYRFGLAAR